MHNVRKNIIRITLAALVLIAGCGLFETRTPEGPETIRSTYIPPTSPDAVITNLTFSLREKNSNNYSKCISTTNYWYVPDSKSQLTYGEIFRNWSFPSEKLYLDNLISQTNSNASSNLFLSNKIISSDSATATADYTVVFYHNRTNVPTSAIGNLRFSLSADESSNFYIRSWEDFRRNDTDFTWSELKATFSN